MADIHELLKELSPCDFNSVPQDEAGLSKYIEDTLHKCQELIDSVPPPPTDPSLSAKAQPSIVASSASDVVRSNARSDAPCHPEHAKQWGKPLKMAEKDNPHGIAVYKMAAHDRKGAWFARRSVHEGLGFARWKKCLESEFHESMTAEGGPGVGNVRGIGAEKRICGKEMPGVGEMKVLHLSAKYPGPAAPRDFVELLISSSKHPKDTNAPRQWLLLSRPCKHPDVPERDGFVRGQYESVEFIREIPLPKTKSVSTSNLPATTDGGQLSNATAKDSTQGNRDRAHTDSALLAVQSGRISHEDVEAALEQRRARGDTIPSKDSKSENAANGPLGLPDGNNNELYPHPVEWIMITRSDPGGSVPKFMVERGTPSAIVSDAGKFLEWATQKEMPLEQTGDEGGYHDGAEAQHDHEEPDAADGDVSKATATAAAQSAHRVVLTRTVTTYSSSSGSSSTDSFVSVGSGSSSVAPSGSGITPVDSTTSSGHRPHADKFAHQERKLAKQLAAKKVKINAKFEETRSKSGGDEAKVKKAEDKRERKEHEADVWFEKEMVKVSERREKAERKYVEKEAKMRDRSQSVGLKQELQRLQMENENLRKELEKLRAVKEED